MYDIATTFVNPLNDAGIVYMVTGSVASMLYGIPRYTNDVDLVMSLPVKQAELLTEVFPEDDFYCPPLEVLTMEISRPLRGHFNIIHHETGYRADVYLLGTDPLHRWGAYRIEEPWISKAHRFLSPHQSMSSSANLSTIAKADPTKTFRTSGA